MTLTRGWAIQSPFITSHYNTFP